MKRLSSNKKAIVAIKPTTNQPKPTVSAKTAKSVEKKTIVSTPKIKPPTKKIKSVDSAEKSRLKNQKLKPPVSAQKTQAAENKKPPIKNVKSVVSVKAKTKSAKLPVVSFKKIKAESVKSKAVENKVLKIKLSKGAKSQEIKAASSTAKVVSFENKIEPKKLPLPPKPKKKKAKPICSAVFRGKKDRYGFEVFPLDAEFEDVSAIYVISKRKIDKRKKGHHALVCIGQTESLLGEIKRHKKGKCVKKYQANVISILPEENEKKRLRIETDLKAAHTVVCNLE